MSRRRPAFFTERGRMLLASLATAAAALTFALAAGSGRPADDAAPQPPEIASR